MTVSDIKSKKLERSISDSELFTRSELDETAAERTGYSNYSYWGSTIRVFSKNKVAMAMLIILVVLLIFTVIQPYLPRQRDANMVNNHPSTGIQLSNQAPSFTSALLTVPEGTVLTVKEYDENWYEASNIKGSINKRTDFTCLEYGKEWSLVEYMGEQGYVESKWLRLDDDTVPSGEFTTHSNYKISMYSSPADITNNGDPVYIEKALVEVTDEEENIGVTTAEADICALPDENGFWFGTNNIGQDLWARVWAGTRTSLFIGIMVALVEALVGIFVGVVWGYVRSLDKIMTEVYNVLDNIPSTIVLILISYIILLSETKLIFFNISNI